MKAEVINVISKEIDNGIAKYYVYKFVIGKTIDFDIVYHKAGDTYKTPWGRNS